MAALLLAAGGFGLWSSQVTSTAAKRAVAATRVADEYQEAARRVGQEESLEREYRLAPSEPVRGEFEVAVDGLDEALTAVRRDDTDGDGELGDDALAEHRTYVRVVQELFDAVDRGDAEAVQRLDARQVEPSFGIIESTVLHAAAEHHAAAQRQLDRLQEVEGLNRRSTPAIFGCVVVLIGALTVISRGQGRLLSTERAQAVHASLHDPLTGLPNRTLFGDRVEQALRLAERENSELAVMLIDLDRFKEINDTFGHAHGDALLVQVGQRLTAALRAVDTVARLGGDEFAVLLGAVATAADARLVAEKLVSALEMPFPVEGVDLDVEASIGIAHSGDADPDVPVDLDTLLQRADTAMYAAKSRGHGVEVYRPGAADAHSPARLTLLGDLRRALDREELVLHYQPKIAVAGQRVVGAEALVRWHHPVTGMVPPDAFIPVAEHTGLIHPLTRYVLSAALRDARAWADAGSPVPVAVNLSARNLLDERLPEHVAELLAEHRVPPALLHLEVTESAIMTEQARARRLLEELAGLGIRISIDDFGAGYTSLSQLRDLPVHELKIDRSFVMTMTTDPANDTIVRSVVDLGHNLGLTIVAEGVETAEALAALGDYGCDLGQGYFFTRPLPRNEFEAWRASWSARPATPSRA